MGVLKPELIFKSIVPIIMAGILGIYGLIVAVILNGKSKSWVPDTGRLFIDHRRQTLSVG
jgi:V-type H+-transporting ATPase proteolipid subunit